MADSNVAAAWQQVISTAIAQQPAVNAAAMASASDAIAASSNLEAVQAAWVAAGSPATGATADAYHASLVAQTTANNSVDVAATNVNILNNTVAYSTTALNTATLAPGDVTAPTELPVLPGPGDPNTTLLFSAVGIVTSPAYENVIQIPIDEFGITSQVGVTQPLIVAPQPPEQPNEFGTTGSLDVAIADQQIADGSRIVAAFAKLGGPIVHDAPPVTTSETGITSLLSGVPLVGPVASAIANIFTIIPIPSIATQTIFSAAQLAWLGGADTTDPVIIARMLAAVPNTPGSLIQNTTAITDIYADPSVTQDILYPLTQSTVVTPALPATTVTPILQQSPDEFGAIGSLDVAIKNAIAPIAVDGLAAQTTQDVIIAGQQPASSDGMVAVADLTSVVPKAISTTSVDKLTSLTSTVSATDQAQAESTLGVAFVPGTDIIIPQVAGLLTDSVVADSGVAIAAQQVAGLPTDSVLADSGVAVTDQQQADVTLGVAFVPGTDIIIPQVAGQPNDSVLADSGVAVTDQQPAESTLGVAFVPGTDIIIPQVAGLLTDSVTVGSSDVAVTDQQPAESTLGVAFVPGTDIIIPQVAGLLTDSVVADSGVAVTDQQPPEQPNEFGTTGSLDVAIADQQIADGSRIVAAFAKLGGPIVHDAPPDQPNEFGTTGSLDVAIADQQSAGQPNEFGTTGSLDVAIAAQQVVDQSGTSGTSGFTGVSGYTGTSNTTTGTTIETVTIASANIQDVTNFEAKADWRVRLSLSPGANYLYKVANGAAGILNPLQATDGVIFPYTPNITVAYAAHYEATSLTHSNYKIFQYGSSSVDNVTITAEFTAQDTSEANYLLAVIHFFKSVTKMFYGQDQDPLNGTPPPLCYLSGLGEYQFDAHPLVITAFTYQLPTDVDYIRAGVGIAGEAAIAAANVLRLSGIAAGGAALPPVFDAKTPYTKPTYVPTKMQIAITAYPIVTRNDISNNFSLKKYATGELLQGSARKGGGIW